VSAIALLTLSGCGAAQLVNVWRDPSLDGDRVRSALVVSQSKDPVARRLWEDAVRDQMIKHGVETVASYSLFPDAPPAKPDMDRALADRGLDHALILNPLPSTTDTHWVPGWTSEEARAFYDPWVHESVVVYRPIRHRGYLVADRIAREQVTLWSAGDGGRMVWAGTVTVENPGSADALRDDLAKAVVPEMKKAGLIG
jgi:hypothetical protein